MSRRRGVPMMAPGDHAADLHVIGTFELRIAGRPVALASGPRRLLAYLAVTGGAQRRDAVTGQLWGWAPQPQARARLRTALWRIRQLPTGVVDTDREEVALRRQVRVDLARSTGLAHDLLGAATQERLPDSPALLTDDILPGWDEDWLQLERERHRQLRIHALEALSLRLTSAGRFGAAIDVAYRAIEAEPLRESAWCVLIRAHLAEGNRSVATHQLGEYRRLLSDELGLSPSDTIESLVSRIG